MKHNNSKKKKRKPLRRRSANTLRFSPYAWAKLLYLRDYGASEVGGFAISSPDDLLFVDDVRLVKQHCSRISVAFEDDSVADFYDEMVDAGLRPEQFGRIWVHTHPGDCPLPSITDDATFERVFGECTWSVMFILASAGECYARLRMNAGPVYETELPVAIDYENSFGACEFDAWEAEYLEHVHVDLKSGQARPQTHRSERLNPDPLSLRGGLVFDDLAFEGFDPLEEI